MANVSVYNTTGLYIGSGNPTVLNSAQSLNGLLANSASVGFYLTNANTRVTAITLGAEPAGTYSNSNVAAFLPTYGGTINAGTIFNDSGFAIQGRDYTQMQYTNGVTPPTSEYDIGLGAWFYIDAGGGIFQSNTTGTLQTITLGHNGNLTVGNSVIVTNGVFWSNGNPYATGGSGTYSNVDVAAYLPIYSGTFANSSTIISINANVSAANAAITSLQSNAGTQQTQINSTNANVTAANSAISTLQSNAGTQQTQINSLNANVTAANSAISTLQSNAGTQQTQINSLNANVTAANSAIQTLNANLGAFQTYANNTFGTSSYSNANVAAYLVTNTGNIQAGNLNVLGNANITGNSIASAYYSNSYLYANGVSILSGIGGTYSNANVASYLASGTDATINAINANVTAANSSIQTLNANVGAFQTYANSTFTSYSNVNVAAYLPTYNGTIGSALGTVTIGGNLTITSRTTTGNLITSAGVFWSNGVNYSAGISGTYSNSNVASYLASGTDATINAINANVTAANVNITTLFSNAATQATSINTINANIGAYQTWANSNFATSNAGSFSNVTLTSYREVVSNLGVISGNVSVNLNTGTVWSLIASGNITLSSSTITNANAGQSFTVIVNQDATGSRLLTSNFLYAGGNKTLSTGASAIDIINVFYNGTNYYATLVKGYQ